jgi:predicted Zn-dependent peptidase
MPVAGVSIAYDVGARHEPKGRTGLAHLFEHVMFQGSRNVGKMEHFSLLNAVGGVVNGGTSQDMTIYHESIPSEHIERALFMEADRLATLPETLTQEKLDNQREVVKNERAQGMDNAPYGLAGEMLLERVFPVDHPYYHTIIGSMHDLDDASLEDVTSFFRTYYAVNNATLVVAGDLDPDEVRRMVNRHFGELAPNLEIPPPPDMSAPEIIGHTAREVVTDKVPLARVYAGYRGPRLGSREMPALQLAIGALSNGPWSRLNGRLVRELELAQDAGIGIDPSVGPSMITGQATVREGGAVDSVEAAYFDVVEGVAKEPITPADLQRARAGLERGHLEALQTAMDRSNQLGIYSVTCGDPEALNRELEVLLSITDDEATAAATKYLRPDNRVTVVYQPEGAA